MNQGIKEFKKGMYKARRQYRVFVGGVYIVGKKWCGRMKRLTRFPVKRTAREKKQLVERGLQPNPRSNIYSELLFKSPQGRCYFC